MREVCEFHHYAATTRPDVYRRVNGTLVLLLEGAPAGNSSGECDLANSFSWGDASANQTCDDDKVRQGASYMWVPLPFLFLLSSLPAWLWRGGNTTFGMWYKLLCETPSPNPSRPPSPLPHTQTLPSLARATLWHAPAATETIV